MASPPAAGTVLAAAAVLLAGGAALGAGGCEPATIRIVGSPGGVYQPDQGCTLGGEAPACPAAGTPAPQLRFEAQADPGLGADPSSMTISNVRVTCTRSYCGTGSLAAHADLTWVDNTDRSAPIRMASFVHTFAPAVEMAGQTLGFSVLVESPTVPMHAQIGVIFDYWRWVAWSPIGDGWHRIEGVVSPDNTLTGIDPGVKSIPVTGIQIDVYVPVADASGTSGSWSGEIYMDDIGWR